MSRGSSSSKNAGQTIKTRIMLVVTAILFFFTLVAGYCLYLVWLNTEQKVTAEIPSQESSIIAEKILDLVTSLKVQVNQFISRPDMQSVPQYQAALDKLNDQTENLKTGADPKSAQLAVATRRVTGEIDTSYQTLVNAWQVKGFSEKTGLREKLHTAVINLEAAVPLSDSKMLRDGLAQVNRAAVEYLGNHGAESLDQLEIAANTLEEIIARASVDGPIKQNLKKDIKAYIIALNRYQAVSFDSDDSTLKAAFAGEQLRQRDAMQRAAQDLKAVISGVNESPLDLKARNLRQHTKEYLLQGKENNAALLDKSLEEYVQELNTSKLPQDQRTDILQALANYKEALGQLEKQNKIIRDATSQAQQSLSQLASQLTPPGRKPVAEPDQDLTTEVITFLSREDIMPAAGALLAVILIGLIAAMSLARSVSAQMVQMTDVGQQVSDGLDASPRQTPENLSHEENGEDHVSVSAPSPEQSLILNKISTAAHQIAKLSEILPQTVEKITVQNQSISDLLDEDSWTHSTISLDAAASPGSTQQLSEIVHAADEMGEEMSVLALNAAIKAARAGTHGKEFSLVAEELDTLAKRSADSARNLALVVENISSRSADSFSPDDDSSEAFSKIAAINSANAQALDAIAVDTNIIIDQAREIEQLVQESNILTGQDEETDRTANVNETVNDDNTGESQEYTRTL